MEWVMGTSSKTFNNTSIHESDCPTVYKCDNSDLPAERKKHKT